jgi:hypothetical protein
MNALEQVGCANVDRRPQRLENPRVVAAAFVSSSGRATEPPLWSFEYG